MSLPPTLPGNPMFYRARTLGIPWWWHSWHSGDLENGVLVKNKSIYKILYIAQITFDHFCLSLRKIFPNCILDFFFFKKKNSIFFFGGGNTFHCFGKGTFIIVERTQLSACDWSYFINEEEGEAFLIFPRSLINWFHVIYSRFYSMRITIPFKCLPRPNIFSVNCFVTWCWAVPMMQEHSLCGACGNTALCYAHQILKIQRDINIWKAENTTMGSLGY